MANGLLVKRRQTGNNGSGMPGQNGAAAEDEGQAPAPVVPFTRAARIKSQQAYSGSFTIGAAAQQLPPIDVPSGGFVKYVDFDFTMVTAGNAATVAFAADGPWSIIQSVSVTNAAGNSIYVPITGYQWMLTNKYMAPGVDPEFYDPRQEPYYSVTTGSGATGGSFRCRLRLFFERDPRDAFLALPNMASNRQYKINLMLAPETSVYTTPPTNDGTLTITATAYYWSQPQPTNALGVAQQTAPLSNGGVGLIRVQTINLTPGDKTLKLENVGNIWRSAVFVLRDAASARVEADLPATNWIRLNNDNLFWLTLQQWRRDMAQMLGFTSATPEAARGPDNGVLAWVHLNAQHGNVRCDGPRSQWLATLDATLLQYQGTSFGGNAATLEVITDEIQVKDAAALYSLNVE